MYHTSLSGWLHSSTEAPVALTHLQNHNVYISKQTSYHRFMLWSFVTLNSRAFMQGLQCHTLHVLIGFATCGRKIHDSFILTSVMLLMMAPCGCHCHVKLQTWPWLLWLMLTAVDSSVPFIYADGVGSWHEGLCAFIPV